MREKYIEERHPRWFNMDTSGCAIDDSNSFIGQAASREECNTLCDEHNNLVDAFVKLAQEFSRVDPEAFKEFWYERSN